MCSCRKKCQISDAWSNDSINESIRLQYQVAEQQQMNIFAEPLLTIQWLALLISSFLIHSTPKEWTCCVLVTVLRLVAVTASNKTYKTIIHVRRANFCWRDRGPSITIPYGTGRYVVHDWNLPLSKKTWKRIYAWIVIVSERARFASQPSLLLLVDQLIHKPRRTSCTHQP